MSSEVIERIHKALAPHPLERIEDGYRLVHSNGAGTGTLRLLPLDGATTGGGAVAVAEVLAEYGPEGLPAFHAHGVQRLNAMAVYGAYALDAGRLRQRAQFTIYANEPTVHLATQTILNAFGAQLPLGRSTAMSTISPAMLEQQRAHHAMPRQWTTSLGEDAMKSATTFLHQRALAASNDATSVWAEVPLSGDCPSRSIDPQAETAILQVSTGIPHPIAGAGYLSTLTLPPLPTMTESAEVCRRLNAAEMELTDFVPRLGAWGIQGPNELPGYCCFLPCPEPIAGLHLSLLWWSVIRAAWLRDRFWVAKQGVTLEKPWNPLQAPESPAAS